MAFRPFRIVRRGFRFGRNFVRGFGRGFTRGYNGVTRPAYRLTRNVVRKVNYLSRMTNAEKKFKDVQSNVSPSAAGTMAAAWLSPISQGWDSQTRIGQSVKALSLQLRFDAEMFPSSTDASVQIRVILFYTSSAPGTSLPTAADILQGPEYLISPLNMNFAVDNEYHVIFDKTFTITATNFPSKYRKIYRRLNHHIKWDTTGNTISDARRGQIFMLAISDATVGQEPSLYYHSRLRYVDD